MTEPTEEGPIESTLMWSGKNLTVRVGRDADGVLHFSGHDFGGFADSDEYEYELTVDAGDVRRVVARVIDQPGLGYSSLEPRKFR